MRPHESRKAQGAWRMVLTRRLGMLPDDNPMTPPHAGTMDARTEHPTILFSDGTSSLRRGTTWSNSSPRALVAKTMASSGLESSPIEDRMEPTASLAANSSTGSSLTNDPHLISAAGVRTTVPVDRRGVAASPLARMRSRGWDCRRLATCSGQWERGPTPRNANPRIEGTDPLVAPPMSLAQRN